MHGPTTITSGLCPNCGCAQHNTWSTASYVTVVFNAPHTRTNVDELLEEWNESDAEYARIGRMRAMAIDTRRRPSGSEARERPARAPCTRAHQRLLGGRQSYARVRCDRKRAVLRARRAGR